MPPKTSGKKIKAVKAWAITKGSGIMEDNGLFSETTVFAVYPKKYQAEQFAENVIAEGKVIPVLITPLYPKK
jgi:hypothetical protein